MYRLHGAATLFALALVAYLVNLYPPADTDQIARVINESGFICSEIVAHSRGMTETMWNVGCVQFHDGTGEAHFAVDTQTEIVMQTY